MVVGFVNSGFEQNAVTQGLVVPFFVGEYTPDNVCCRQTTSGAVIEEKRPALVRFEVANLRAMKLMYDDPETTIATLAAFSGQSEDYVKYCIYDGCMKISMDPAKNRVVEFFDVMKANGDIDADVENTMADHVDASIYLDALNTVLERYPDDVHFQEMLEEHEEEIYQLDGKVKWFISNPEGTMISCARAINSLSDLSTIGIVSVNVSEAYIRSFYSELTLPSAGQVYIIDEENTVLSSYDGENMGQTIGEEFQEVLADGGDKYTELDNGDTVYVSDWMTNRWRLVVTIPASYYMSGVSRIGVVIFVSVVIMALVAAVIVSMMTKHLTKPINELACAMTDFGNGNFDAKSPVTSSDEIGLLSDTFNRMVADMNSLCDRVYEQQILRQDAELKTLQMQINPHFLYNTLDTINWMSRAKGVDDVGEMAYALGCLLRHSLSKGDFTTLEHELNALEYYLKIQNYRYSDKLTAVIDIDPSFYNIDIPKLLIQPVVENAIIHGIEEKLDSGTVRIWAEMDGTQDVLIRVEDDGVGMSEATLQRILRDTQDTGTRGRPHIGVANVDKRIRMYYGEGYGLEIESALGRGTRVTLRIKALREPPDAEPM